MPFVKVIISSKDFLNYRFNITSKMTKIVANQINNYSQNPPLLQTLALELISQMQDQVHRASRLCKHCSNVESSLKIFG